MKLGFAGIYVNRKGYEAGGRALIDGLSEKLHQDPMHSPNEELVFFKLPTAAPVQ